MQTVQTNTVNIQRQANGQDVILFDAEAFPQAPASRATNDHWQTAEPLIGRGGRGAAILVRDTFGEGVLRHYRRGGLLGRWLKDRYTYLGESRVRCVREFYLLAELYQRGLPVPQPLLARWQKTGWFYQADLLTRRVLDSKTLTEKLQEKTKVDWAEVGKTIAMFHREGVFHADLNAHNILIDTDEKVWVIDFDRGALLPSKTHWQHANLHRLQRSLTKLGLFDHDQWLHFLHGYQTRMQMSQHGVESA